MRIEKFIFFLIIKQNDVFFKKTNISREFSQYFQEF